MLSGMSDGGQEGHSISKISKFSNKVENSIISKAGGLDYTNTRFHNALIMRHDTEQAMAEELKKGAFDLAKDEATKANIQKAQKENLNRMNQEKAKKRGKEALEKVTTKRDQELYEKEMKKVQIEENWEKIKNGIKDKSHSETGNIAYQEKKEKQKKEKLESVFEQEFFSAPAQNPDQNNAFSVPKSEQIKIIVRDN